LFLMIRRPPKSTLFPLHDALPILNQETGKEEWVPIDRNVSDSERAKYGVLPLAELLKRYPEQKAREKVLMVVSFAVTQEFRRLRSEEHTSELQSRRDLVCRLLLEK